MRNYELIHYYKELKQLKQNFYQKSINRDFLKKLIYKNSLETEIF